jgi:hypothetical protein
MKAIGTDGREYIINLPKCSKEVEDLNRSSLHLEARVLLKKKFPYSTIYEEILLKGCKGIGATLTADFFIPDFPILVEVHGAQHYKFNKFFHGTEASFKTSQSNDLIKKTWAENNGIIYIELPYNEVKNWGKIIDGHI